MYRFVCSINPSLLFRKLAHRILKIIKILLFFSRHLIVMFFDAII